MFYAIVDKIVVTLQSLILYMVSTYDYCITVTQPSLEVCAKTVGHTVMPRSVPWPFAVNAKKED
jgi:hypothetical protein